MVVKDTNDEDLLIAKITSQSYNTSYVKILDWKQAGLLSPSVIRIHKIQTLHSSLIFGHIGRLTLSDLKSVKQTLMNLVREL